MCIRDRRRSVGLVLQEPFLYSRTIGENIAIARPGAAMDDITAAARTASVHDVIESFEHGYSTVVGERGVTPVSYTHLDVYKRQTLRCSATEPGTVKASSPSPMAAAQSAALFRPRFTAMAVPVSYTHLWSVLRSMRCSSRASPQAAIRLERYGEP